VSAKLWLQSLKGLRECSLACATGRWSKHSFAGDLHRYVKNKLSFLYSKLLFC
jgi:hypothetical protein